MRAAPRCATTPAVRRTPPTAFFVRALRVNAETRKISAAGPTAAASVQSLAAPSAPSNPAAAAVAKPKKTG